MKNQVTFKNLATSNLSDSAENEVVIKDFGGVDYSHSTLFVDTSRATQMSNFIKEDGINQKRKGYREIYQFPATYKSDSDGQKVADYDPINGVWELTTSLFNKEKGLYELKTNIIVQAGNKFYAMLKKHTEKDSNGVEEVIIEEGITTEANDYDSRYTLSSKEIKFPSGKDYSSQIPFDTLSTGIVADEKLYVLTGSIYLMIGYFGDRKELEIRKVEDDEYTYLPTTTINIPPNEYNKCLDDSTYVLKSSAFDDVNMLNRNRKNLLLGLDKEALIAHSVAFQIHRFNLIKDEDGNYKDESDQIKVPDPNYYLNTTDDIEKPFVFTYTLDSIPYDMQYEGSIEERVDYALTKMVVKATGTILRKDEELSLDQTVIQRVEKIDDFYLKTEEDVYEKKKELLYMVEYDIQSTEDDKPYGECKLTFNYNVVPKGNGNTISVEFERYIKSADKINGCRFGCMYGLNNQGDRLFVSGNKEYPNMDYHTVESYVVDEFEPNKSASAKVSLTYFGDLTYTKLGGTVNAINGYAILGDGKMAIFKTLSGQEPTIYFRTASTLSEEVEDANQETYTKISEVYPVQVGTIGEGSVGFNTIQNLNGDILMLSSNGVFGIELDSNVASSQRLAKRRSRLIDPVLCKYDLANAKCTTFDDKYYLCLEDGKVFVADARYPIRLKDDLDNEFNYEWWEWNGINARVFFVIQNKLWFGTSTGMLCCFEELNYKDTTVLDIDEEDICFVEDKTQDYNTKLVVSPQYISSLENMSSYDTFLSHDPIYALAFETAKDEVSVDKNIIRYDYSGQEFANEKDLKHFIEFMITLANYSVCFDGGSIDPKEVFKIYTVMHDQEKRVFTYEIRKNLESEEIIDLKEKGFRVCLKLFEENNQPSSICNVGMYSDGKYYLYEDYHETNGKYYFTDEEGITVKEMDSKPKFNHFSLRDYTTEGRPLKIINYNGITPIVKSGKFTFNKNVSCYYVTPPFDMGTRYYNKDLKKLIIVPDTLLGTSVDFGFKTSNYSKDFNAYTGKAFNFNELDFDNLNFLSETFAKVYVKQARKKRWSYIQFFFKSDTDNNCKINNLTIIYTLGTKNKGVR